MNDFCYLLGTPDAPLSKIASVKDSPKSFLFPTSKSTIKFEVFHPTSEVAELKGGHEK